MDHPSFTILAAAANDPAGYATQWKARTGRRVVGCLPMNFPPELVAAAGALPLQLQESRDAITLGNAMFPTFYCGFTRSLVDQAMRGEFGMLDALYFVDNCVQLIGAADVVRARLNALRVRYFQIDPSMKAGSSTRDTATRVYGQLRDELASLTGAAVDDDALRESIARHNHGRHMLRQIQALRRTGRELAASDMQVLVKAGMVMEREEFNSHLRKVLEFLLEMPAAPHGAGRVRVHLSGHLCQAPKPELLDLIEDCGAEVVNDDLFHGARWFATDVPATGDPRADLVAWYFARNIATPCPTRTHTPTRWSESLPDAATGAGAEGVITLLVKFCEPHMYLIPEIGDALQARSIPHLLIETEHEGMPLESIRTRLESFVESIRSRRGRRAAAPRIEENA
ncbi:2-hydroxyacyl-CoA dehydratase subunit D [Ramlibacter sp.]|uniref:2-hydroxyacyl-CoA dehydratase subunit D n=1 Tax=Ramlibacter sp. TaxID=1917967 RepID=UPI003D122EFA